MTVSTEDTAICAECGASLECRPGADCWCAKRPFLAMPEDPVGCLCPRCLDERVVAAALS